MRPKGGGLRTVFSHKKIESKKGGFHMTGKRVVTVFIFLLLFSCIAISLFGSEPVGEKLRIAYIRPTNEPYYKFGFDGAKMMAEAMDVDILGYISDMKPEKEIASVEDAITQRVDGIVLMSVSVSSLAAGINKAYEADIPIQMIFGYNEDLMDKMVGSVQADCNLSGSIMGNWVAENMQGGEVAIIMGLPGRGDAECYRDAFIREAEKNANIEVVASVPGDWNRQKAFNQMQTLIIGYPDLVAVFVQNEDMSLGAIKALEEADMADKVAIVSQNGAPYGLDSIAAGGIQATVGWSPSQEAALATRFLIEHIRGTSVPKLTITPMKVITKDNIDEAVPWEPTAASIEATLKLDPDDLIHDFAMGAGY
jgi:ribose transport system substrate-binding protein